MNMMLSFPSKAARIAALLFLISLIGGGCTSRSTVFHAYQAVDKNGWGKHDTVIFQLPQDSLPDVWQLNVGVRIDNHIPYTTLWLVLSQDLEKKGVFEADTIPVSVTNKQGILNGSGYSSYQQEVKAIQVKTGPKGGHTVKVTHVMKREDIPGVWYVGLNVSSDSLRRLYEGK